MKYIIIPIVLMVFSWLISGCGTKQEPPSLSGKDQAIPVRLLSIEQKSGVQVIHTTGLITTDDETVLSFKNGGVIERIYVKEGDAVKSGQLLAVLKLTEINTAVAQAELGLQKAERDYQRAAQLYKDSVATLEQMQNAATALDFARQDIQRVRFNQQYAEIRATANGYVLMKMANDGQIVGPGTPVLQVNGAGKGKWMVKVNVNDRQWAAVKIGDTATVTLDAYAGKLFQAVVSAKAEGINPASGAFMVQLSLLQPGAGMATGLFAKVVLYPGEKVSAWQIPFDALIDGDGQQGFVFVTTDKKTAAKIPVKIGAIGKDNVEIIQGLEHVEHLIISGSPYLQEGDTIQIRD